MNTRKLISYIHEEIAGMGTGSIFIGHGLNAETGEYNADDMAERIETGELHIDGLDLTRFSVSGTPPNTSLVLTDDELEFIANDPRFGGSKSAAIHAALAELQRSA